MFTVPDVHMHTSLLYIMSIQPVNKAVEHLINSAPVLEKRKKKQSMLILERTVREGGGALTSSWKDWMEFYGCIK